MVSLQSVTLRLEIIRVKGEYVSANLKENGLKKKKHCSFHVLKDR